MAGSSQFVKELREKTGAGILDCQKALTENDNDIEKAIDYLRQKGLAAAAKKAGRMQASPPQPPDEPAASTNSGSSLMLPVPLGLGAYVRAFGHERVRELDWWQQAEAGGWRWFEATLLVVGSGAGGLSCAITAAKHGLKVIVTEKAPV